MIKLRRYLILIFFVLLMFIFLLMKSPIDNKNQQKISDLYNKMKEIESLLKSTKINFEMLRKALLNMQINGTSKHNLDSFKSILNLMISKSSQDHKKHFSILYKKVMSCDNKSEAFAEVDTCNLLQTLDFSDTDGGVWKQGFDVKVPSTADRNRLTIFVVPHSHQDPGWIKTFENYFTQQTKFILDSMLEFLFKNKEMTFIYAEMSFFEKWWNLLDDKQKQNLNSIMKRKQLEIVTGGWVMNDEANTHFYSIITQLTEGHRWLNETFGYQSQSAWSIDLFGHSVTMPYLLKKAGLKNVVIQRVHYILKKELAKKKRLEFMWQQSWDSTGKYNMLTHMMPFFSYDVPHTCGPDPKICCQFDFVRMLKYYCPWGVNPVNIDAQNVQSSSELLLDQYRKKAALFNTNVLLIPLGDDFRYLNEEEWNMQFENYMKIMNYLNENSKYNVKIQFGTITDYFNKIGSETKQKWPTLTGDMFTYADRNDHYWSGYYTSRPLIKVYDRLLAASLRSSEIAQSLAMLYQKKYKSQMPELYNDKLFKKLDFVRKMFSLAQHHDTITGTSKRHVTIDGGNKILKALKESKEIFLEASQNILNNKEKFVKSAVYFELDDVVKSYGEEFEHNFVDLTSTNERLVYIFNSLAQPRQAVIHVPIKLKNIGSIWVINSGNLHIPCQVSPYNLKKQSADLHTVSFIINIGPLTYEQIKVVTINKLNVEPPFCKVVEIKRYNEKGKMPLKAHYKVTDMKSSQSLPISIDLEGNSIYINSMNGQIESIRSSVFFQTFDFNVFFKHYGARHSSETSGAYLFIPDGEGEIYENKQNVIYHIIGNVYEEIIVHRPTITTYMKFYQVDGLLANAIDVENVIDVTGKDNFELSMVVATNALEVSDKFFTDSNCLQFIKRISLDKLPIQANVYPATCGAYAISNSNEITRKLTLLSAQSNGVRGGKMKVANKPTSFLEVFQDRILSQDDNRGMLEMANDNKIVTKHFRIVLDLWQEENPPNYSLGELTVIEKELLNDLNYPVEKLIVKKEHINSVNNMLAGHKSLMTGFGLPCDYHLVTLRSSPSCDSPDVLLQRSHLNCQSKFNSEGSCRFSKKTSPLFKSLFDDLSIKSVRKSLITGLNVSSETIIPEQVSVDTMDIENFKLEFDFNV